MPLKFSDNARTTLAAGVSNTDTILSLAPGAGARYPTAAGGNDDYFVLTMEDASGNREFIRVNYRTGDTLGSVSYPCERGYWGSTARSWTTSDVVDLRWSANAVDEAFDTRITAPFDSHITMSGKQVREDLGSNIASGATVDIGSATGNYVTVDHAGGTATITSLGGASIPAGTSITVLFQVTGGTLNLSHSSPTITLPYGQTIVVSNGDVATFRKDTDGVANWRCVNYQFQNQVSDFSRIVAPGGLVTGSVTFGSNVTVQTPSSAGHAATKAYVDLHLPKAGGNMTGQLNVQTAGIATTSISSNNYGIYAQTQSASFGGVIGYTADGLKYGVLGHVNLYSFYGDGRMYVTTADYHAIEGRATNASYGGVLGANHNGTMFGLLGFGESYSFYGSGLLYNIGEIIATGNITAYSDERLKQNWGALPWDFVRRLSEVKSGTFDRMDTLQRQVGVSAQSLQEIMPEAVEDHDGTLTVAYGNAALASAVELAKEVVELRAQVDMLMSKVQDLEARH